MEKIGALPFIKEILDNDYLVDKQNKLNAGLLEWLSQAQPNLDLALQTIEDALNLPTKENFSFLFGETLEIAVPFIVQIPHLPYFAVMLNPETFEEFDKYVEIGLIDIITGKSDYRLNRDSHSEKIFYDKKRTLQAGFKCVIQINESYYR